MLINDVNDNSPIFSASSPLRLSISEAAVPGDQMSTFQLPTATDADGPDNSDVGYQLQPETHSLADNFRLSVVNSSATGSSEVRLRLVNGLDREMQAEHRLTLVASDSGVPALSASLLIIVNVEDSNDNRPVFERPEYDVSVPETAEVGAKVAVVRALDADAGANGQVTYRFSERGRGRDDFRLDGGTGVVVVGRRLDFARQREYRLGVLAADGGVGGLASFVMLTVHVIDENDHAPLIDVQTAEDGPRGSVSVDVPRHATVEDRFVAHVSVTDDDGGDNGRVTCWLNASQRTTSDGLRRSTAAYTTTPSVAAATSKSDRNQFIDDVTAMAAPAFDLVRLFENEYKIQLTINASTTPDDVTESEYNVSVTCRDHGFLVRMTSSTVIHVTIRHVDDDDEDDSLSAAGSATTISSNSGQPRFVFPSPSNDTIHVSAGLPVGHVVAVVLATAAGTGSEDVSLSYELVNGNGSTYFDVDRTSGRVKLVASLRVDQNATFKLIIGVSGADDSSITVFALAELYVVTWTVEAGPVTSLANGGNAGGLGGDWSLWLLGHSWSNVALMVVISCSLVLGAVLFAAVLVVHRKSRCRVQHWLALRRRRPQTRRRKLTSSYHVAVEFTANDDGLNNVAMATASHEPATGLIGRTTSAVS